MPLRFRALLCVALAVAAITSPAARASCAVWSLLPPGTAPSARVGHAMVYDAARDRVVLFSGTTSGVQQTSTWLYNPASETWQVSGAGSTSPRDGHAIVYVSVTGHVVLFSGFTAGSGLQNATWRWNGTGWAVLASTGPAPRTNHAMAYDIARNRIVLFGGIASPQRLGDTWEFNPLTNVWTQIFPGTSPTARASHAMVYDAARQRTVLHGGISTEGTSGETWEWDGGAWTRIDLPGPGVRYDLSMIYDAARARTILFAGTNGDQLADTWEYDGVAWTKWTVAGPPGRFNHEMAYDTVRQRAVMFGGRGEAFMDFGDTWRLDLSPWALAPASIAPVPARFTHAMAEDSARGGVLIYGGNQISGPPRSDTLFWSGSALTIWSAPGPGPRAAHAMADDAARAQVLLFGGDAPGLRGDTWAWRGPVDGWIELTPDPSPSARTYSKMAYDAARDRVVLFGGFDGVNILNDTWEWDGAAWTQAFSPNAPPARNFFAMAYDAARARIVLHGGSAGVGFLDTWEYDGADWTLVDATSGAPGARAQHAMAFNPSTGRVIQYGGTIPGVGGSTREVWEWLGDQWRRLSLLTPPSRIEHAMAQCGATGAVVLVGGIGSVSLGHELWESRRDPAIINAHPIGQVVAPGESASFFVGAQGSGALSYQWRKNGSDLVDGDVVAGVNTPTLVIFPADPFDDGVYDAVVTNSCAATGSAGATLAVVKGPACPADIDGDGAVGASDLAQLLGAWGEAGALGPADLDQSGAVNSADLAQLLGAWGACE